MLRPTLQIALAMALVAGCAASSAPTTGTPHGKKARGHRAQSKPAQKQEVPPAPSVPAPPPTLAQQSPVPPRVTYQNGLLTIDAPNSTLTDVLNAVRRATGAQVEGGSSSDRVVVHLGPAPTKDVLAALLNGSHFDYVILGSTQRAGAVDRVILTPRMGGGASTAAPTTNASAQPPAATAPATAPNNEDNDVQPGGNDDTADQEVPDRDTNENNEQPEQPEQQEQNDQQQQVQQPGAVGAPNQQQPNQPGNPNQNPNAADQQNPGQGQPKTPEQLFKELQQLEQQRRQQQQQQQQNPQ